MAEGSEKIKPHLLKDKVILIAEDEDLNFRFLDAVLQRAGARILRAKDGFEAVRVCSEERDIDIVLMDIKMPGLDGFEAVTRILKARRKLPVIAQTALANHDEIRKCQDAGFSDYISKPIDINLLISKILLYS